MAIGVLLHHGGYDFRCTLALPEQTNGLGPAEIDNLNAIRQAGIHLNPLRAKIVADLKALDGYGYGGHSVLMGRRRADWQDSAYVLKLFGGHTTQGRKLMRSISSSFPMPHLPKWDASLLPFKGS